MSQYASRIQSVFIEERIDILRIHEFDKKEFGMLMADRIGDKKMRGSAYTLLRTLKKRISLKTVPWSSILNAVSHEMNEAIADDIKSISNALGTLNAEVALKLPDELNQKTKRKLTVPEAQYLRGLLRRTFGARIRVDLSQQNDSYVSPTQLLYYLT